MADIGCQGVRWQLLGIVPRHPESKADGAHTACLLPAEFSPKNLQVTLGASLVFHRSMPSLCLTTLRLSLVTASSQ